MLSHIVIYEEGSSVSSLQRRGMDALEVFVEAAQVLYKLGKEIMRHLWWLAESSLGFGQPSSPLIPDQGLRVLGQGGF